MNISWLCSDLSTTTGERFSFSFISIDTLKVKVLRLWMMKVAVRRPSRVIFWTTRYLTTLWNVPISILQVCFILNPLVEILRRNHQHHLYDLLPFGFKPTLVMNHTIVRLDDRMSCNNSTSYSYWCSHLNQTTHIAWSSNQFPYSVTLGTQGPTISRLSTRALLRKPQTT